MMAKQRKNTIMKFRIEDDIKESVVEQSAKKGVTVSEYMRLLIRQDLRRKEIVR
jgi:antitoxin component of RelBE/YafQ-DinJ toxin-antitoxin module